MMNRFYKFPYSQIRFIVAGLVGIVVIVMALFLEGCSFDKLRTSFLKTRKKQTQTVDLGSFDPNVVIPDYAARAMDATGTLDAWEKTKTIQAGAIVTFYNPDGSRYLTEQNYRIHPWANSILISAVEPQGAFKWQLSPEGFTVLKGGGKIDALPVKVCRRYFAEAILNITTAPVRFLDRGFGFTKSAAVKKEGLWYYPVERAGSDSASALMVFYQNSESSLVDMLWFADIDRESFFAVRGYNYREAEKGGVWLPAGIEIFKTDAHDSLQQRLVKIDFK